MDTRRRHTGEKRRNCAKLITDQIIRDYYKEQQAQVKKKADSEANLPYVHYVRCLKSFSWGEYELLVDELISMWDEQKSTKAPVNCEMMLENYLSQELCSPEKIHGWREEYESYNKLEKAISFMESHFQDAAPELTHLVNEIAKIFREDFPSADCKMLERAVAKNLLGNDFNEKFKWIYNFRKAVI